MEKAMTKMLLEVVSEISVKYGLDISEVKREIGLDVEVRVLKEKEKGKKIMLPFCGRIDEERCQGIKINYGLYTQCENNIFQKKLCKTCHKQSKKNSDGKPNYGTIDERLDKNYKDKNGKQPIKYSKFMEKMNITREMAEKEAEEQGVTIPEEEFEIKKTGRGRPKKSTSTTDTSDEESIAEPKKRGRPPKEKKVIENGNVGDDLIKNLIEEANKNEPKKVATPLPKEPTPEPKKAATPLPKEPTPEPKKAATPLPKEPTPEPKKEATPEPKKAATPLPKEPTPEPKKAATPEPKKAATPEPKKAATPEADNDDDSDDEEETVVVPFTFKGVKYLKATDNTIYDINTHEEVGVWDEEKQEIVPDDDDDDED
jgi:hypothetical protein